MEVPPQVAALAHFYTKLVIITLDFLQVGCMFSILFCHHQLHTYDQAEVTVSHDLTVFPLSELLLAPWMNSDPACRVDCSWYLMFITAQYGSPPLTVECF